MRGPASVRAPTAEARPPTARGATADTNHPTRSPEGRREAPARMQCGSDHICRAFLLDTLREDAVVQDNTNESACKRGPGRSSSGCARNLKITDARTGL
eukprot:1134245-Alexandrium_andersonii.AAC.1